MSVQLRSPARATGAAVPVVSPAERSLLERHPHERRVALRGGEEVWLPLHIQGGRGVVLSGLANLDGLAAHLAPHGLRPIPVARGRGLVALYGMKYEQSDLGGYNDFAICVAATRDVRPRVPALSTIRECAGLLAVHAPILHGLLGDRSLDPLFSWKIYVTNDLARRAGREIWGFPKAMGEVEVSVSDRAAGFSVEEQGQPVLRGSYQRLLPWRAPVAVDAYLATPADLNPSVFRGMADTQSRFDLFLPWDRFELNPRHQWGRVLQELGFRPLLWHTMTELESVFQAPL
jgi:hypothetical protein